MSIKSSFPFSVSLFFCLTQLATRSCRVRSVYMHIPCLRSLYLTRISLAVPPHVTDFYLSPAPKTTKLRSCANFCDKFTHSHGQNLHRNSLNTTRYPRKMTSAKVPEKLSTCKWVPWAVWGRIIATMFTSQELPIIPTRQLEQSRTNSAVECCLKPFSIASILLCGRRKLFLAQEK